MPITLTPAPVLPGIANVVEDTTPQLGGDLDLQSNKIVGNGGSTGIAVSVNGEVTMAAQPAFLAFNSSTDSNVTGNGASATVDFDTEVYDQNADFASDTFTAPVAGRYTFKLGVRLSGITSAADSWEITVITSNRTFFHSHNFTDNLASLETISFTMDADMDASDTVTVVVVVSGEASDVVDIQGNATNLVTHFSGRLVA